MSPHVPMTTQAWFTAGELAEMKLPGLATTKRGVLNIAERQGWATYRNGSGESCSRPRQGRGGGVEYHVSLLPEMARAKLSKARPAKVEKVERDSALLRYERLPQSLKDEALRRLKVIQRVETLQRDGLTKTKAVEYAAQEVIREARAAGEKPSVSERTIHAWFQLVLGVETHHRVAYLAPSYAGKASTVQCPVDAWEAYKTAYCRLEKPTHARCYAELQRLAANKGWTLPSAKYFARRIEKEIPRDTLVLLREGPKAVRHTFAYADRTREGLYPHRVANLDGHLWDVQVEWEDGTVGRPYSLAVQDIASGMPLAVRFDRTLNHHIVRLALGDTFRDFGLVERLIMDNGTENQAKQISGGIPRMRGKAVEEEPSGLLQILGIEAVFATPYWGQAKPVERMFRNWAHDIAKSALFAGAYTGHNALSKPENHRSKAIPIAEFERIIRVEIEYYRDQLGRSGAGMNGRSFRQAYQEGIAANPPKRLTGAQLRLCMLASEPRPMDRQSGAVTVLDHRYWSAELSALQPQRVIVRFDPADLSKAVYVYSLDGRFLAEAPRVMQGNFDDVQAARAISKARRDHKRKVTEVAKSAVRLGLDQYAADLAAASHVPEVPAATSNIVAPAFGVPRTHGSAALAISFEEQQDRALAQFRPRP